ncbi:MAG: methyltransferase domain-containing protein [Thermoanaerobaculia bacterium]
MRRLLRRFVPREARRWLRRAWTEAPIRLRDLLPDLRERLRPGRKRPPLPPARLRARVSGTSSRREFLDVGHMAAADIRRAFDALKSPADVYPRWLDFGCGSGRIARHLIAAETARELWGVDVDREAVEWSARNFPSATFRTIAAAPPTALPAGHFNAVIAGSVFTHLSEDAQGRWLSELHRLLRPGGVLIACTHSPKLTFMRPDLTGAQHEELAERGFLFAPGGGPFNEDSTFHSREYLERAWGPWFRLELFEELGYCGFQDLSGWRKRLLSAG